MDETKKMVQEIRKITIILGFFVSGISVILFQGKFSTIGAGVLIGACSGIIGFHMIVHMSQKIELYANPKLIGYTNYVRRYAIYTVIFLLSVYKGINIFSLLVGILCHKAAILIHVFIHRKEDD